MKKFNILFEEIMNELKPTKIFKYYVIIPNEKIVFGSDSKEECENKIKEDPTLKLALGTTLQQMGWNMSGKTTYKGEKINDDASQDYEEQQSYAGRTFY